jgi:hypothetical protein
MLQRTQEKRFQRFMTYGVSFRVAPGVHVYSKASGAFVSLMLGFGFLGAYFRLFFLSIQIVVMVTLLCLAVVGFVCFVIAGYFMTKRRVLELQARAIAPASVEPAGRYTNPPTWGVYRVEGFAAGRRTTQYRVGNHPIRQQELIRELGAAELIMLLPSSADAKEVKHLLDTGRITTEITLTPA